MEVAALRYPKKSHRKTVVLPTESSLLAEFFGIMLGDGGINNAWQATITLNSESDATYAKYIERLCKKIFGIVPVIRKRKTGRTLIVSLASTTVVDFLVMKGLPRGNKLRHGLAIPRWILQRQEFRIACVRGLVDTDGCLFVHNHIIAKKRYKNIGFCFTSFSPELIKQVATIFVEFGIIPHIASQGRRIYLYKEEAVAHYIKIFGTSNDRIRSVYEKWRRGG
ncbi:MAG: LAGLIDADG family homing endonuclease [Patescibacteria group bacterium]